MKKSLLIIFVALASLSSYAWDFKTFAEFESGTFNISDFTFDGDNYGNTNNKNITLGHCITRKNCKFESQEGTTIGGVTVNIQTIGGVPPREYLSNHGIYVGPKGLFFGILANRDYNYIHRSTYSISVGYAPGYYINRVKLYYTRLISSMDMSFSNYNVKQFTSEKVGDGYVATFDLYLPQRQFELVAYNSSDTGLWDISDDFVTAVTGSNGYGRGVFINKIEVEIAHNTGQVELDAGKYYFRKIANDQKELATAQSELATVKENILKQVNIDEIQEKIDQTEHTAYVARTTAATAGDVNLDGAVNAADVVSVYNYISSGTNDNIYNGHRYVDLELPSGTLWADCNVGATVPEGYGDYFTWAGNDGSFLSGKFPFSTDTYKSNVPKSQTTSEATILENYLPPMASDLYKDSWNGWCAPSLKACMELMEYCDKVRATINGVEGTLFTSKINHRTLFFPHAGFIRDDRPVNTSVMGTYWTGSSVSAGMGSSFRTNGYGSDVTESERYFGRSLRCVVPWGAVVK